MDMVRALHGIFIHWSLTHMVELVNYHLSAHEYIKILSAQHDYVFSLSVSEILHRLQIMVHKDNVKILIQ